MAAATDTDTDTATDTSTTHGEHPTPRLYVQIAGVLFVLTALEFSTYFIDFAAMHIPLLLILMAVKFGLVAGFFMHLKYDTRLFSRVMYGGLIGALGLYAITFAALAEIPRGL